jgi:iron complex outermembrane recepter protein
MRRGGLLTQAAVAALAIGMMTGAAQAQTTDSAGQTGDEDQAIIVTGIRQSVQGSIQRKKNAAQVVDSIVADDIGKLPDLTAVDALQRVPGVSITRDRGEGGSARIRGLSQVLTTIDGRESFTADGGRGYNLEDMPAELLGGIDVYKTPTAEQIEGGISGSIDLRTRMPFDFAKTTISGSIRARYSDLADKVSPIYSGLFSTRWDTGIGEMGFLITAVNQTRYFRSDNPGWGGAMGRTDLVAGQNTYLTLGDYEPLIYGKRSRPGVNAAFQWRPASNLEIYAQFGYQKYQSYQQQYGFNAPATATSTVVPGSVSLFSGTNNVQKISFSNLSAYTFGVERDTKDQNSQYALGFKWDKGPSELKVDFSYMKSSNHLWYTELDLKFVPPTTTFDYSDLYPNTSFSGINLGQLSSYTVGTLSMNVNNYKGDVWAIRADDKIALGDGFLTNLKIGGRVNRRSLQFYDVVRYTGTTTNTDPTAYASLFEALPFSDYISADAHTPRGYLVANPAYLKHENFENIRNQLGITKAVTFSPQSPYRIEETAKAGYAMLEFANEEGLRFDGNVGLRYVRTDLNTDSFSSATGGIITPFHRGSSYEDWLPSANVRFKFSDDFFLRLAYSKTLTRPGTGQLSPSLTLVPLQGTASGGNPDLKPLRSTGYDMSLERYFGKSGSLYFAAFDRHVKDFIYTNVRAETIEGINYIITSPRNGKYGHTRGFEVGASAFFDFLPGVLSGFGAQGNFTYVDSDTDQVITNVKTKLPGIPTKQLAASLLYEKYGISSRLSYTWRNTAFSGVYSFTYTGSPTMETGQTYAIGYGWLDGSVSYDVTKNITASVEFSNITGTHIRNSRGAYRPTDYSVDDRQILFGVRFKY